MKAKELNMLDLEKDIASVEFDAKLEEQANVDANYAALKEERDLIKCRIPFSDIQLYTIGDDYEERRDLAFKKNQNKPFWDKIKQIDKYYSHTALHKGHVKISGEDYYILDSITLDSKQITVGYNKVFLINSDDQRYLDYIRWWRYPSENYNVQLSRNITMGDRKVKSVDVVLDKSSSLFADVSDAYLRKALIRNKNRLGIDSIIQTIQKKQDNIRALPKEESFVVQGCAGSGKTMVLLHRLRYLLYNRYISSNDYVFLVPGSRFKEFINEVSVKFNINSKNILSYQEYYRDVLGKNQPNDSLDTSELIFSQDYLKTVYSKDFIKDVYRSIFEIFANQAERLIELCDNRLNELIEQENMSISLDIDALRKKAVIDCKNIIKDISELEAISAECDYTIVESLIGRIQQDYFSRKEEYDKFIKSDVDVVISEDDERLLLNKELMEITNKINNENEAIKKASVFTRRAHENKLNKFQKAYENLKKEVVSALIEEEKEKRLQYRQELVFVYNNVTLDETNNILTLLKNILSSTNELIAEKQNLLDNIQEYIEKRFSKEIDEINQLITVSGDIEEYIRNYVDNLVPAYAFLEEHIKIGAELLYKFNKDIDGEEKRVKNQFTLFSKRTQSQLYSYLYTLMFNACKAKIKSKFEIRICDLYKHYWYIALYCNYLMRPMQMYAKKHIFVDEAQDLSPSEIDLIYKINATSAAPTLNLFGDVHQMITTHGISDWSQLDFVKRIYILDENFRNTNQVVDYCNRNLSIKMSKIGVDMDEVSVFQTAQYVAQLPSVKSRHITCIVKDDYAMADLKILLEEFNIEDFDAYTVKDVKGLEFKEVFVFDVDMSDKEKYIAYTRALSKLNVVKDLPQKANRNEALIVQGNEGDETL